MFCGAKEIAASSLHYLKIWIFFLHLFTINIANCLSLCTWMCHCSSLEAVNRIYEIKGRKHTSPLAICVGDVASIDRYAVIDHLPHGLLDSLLPGPVTVVLWRGLSFKYLGKFSDVVLKELGYLPEKFV